jgi:glyoxylase-like metal-dependent hydrolase (beta-lactamase superfamily II)
MSSSVPEVRVISIGALAAHPMRGERAPVRTGHSTTTLITAGDARILVDPGLPGPAIVARLEERAGLSPEQITHVFLTSFHPETRRGLEAFPDATWMLSETERESVGVPIVESLKRIGETVRDAQAAGEELDEDQETMLRVLKRDVAILQRTQAAPDSLAPGVDLFPLPGLTPGLTGLLVLRPSGDILICADAIPTVEHLEQGKVLQSAADVDQARESFQEAIEIADLLVLGRDNMVVNPTKRPF